MAPFFWGAELHERPKKAHSVSTHHVNRAEKLIG